METNLTSGSKANHHDNTLFAKYSEYFEVLISLNISPIVVSSSFSTEKWKEFFALMDILYGDAVKNRLTKYDCLSDEEIALCYFGHIGIKHVNQAIFFGITSQSLSKRKLRLKKKMPDSGTMERTPNMNCDVNRKIWCHILYKIASPVLSNMSEGLLKENMPVEYSMTWDGRNKQVAYMECFGRLMAGLAPWLSLEDDDTFESEMRKQLRTWALLSYANAVNPENPDYLLWEGEWQPLVDAAYIAHSFLRGYEQLWLPLDEETKRRYVDRFKRLRQITPPYNNWLMFPAIIETFLLVAGKEYDQCRISLAIHKMEEWYVGDGWYSDGPRFAFDYYGSYVIHPMYVECLETLTEVLGSSYLPLYKKALQRMQRYGCILERLISPEGCFPVVGRSITYRTAVFQPLAMLALNDDLPSELSCGQVCAALTAVIKRMFEGEQNFTQEGYLALGMNGYQPNIANYYTNTGSLYIASLAFLPLGLPPSHPFWTSRAEQWTSQKVWSGTDSVPDQKYI